MMHLNTTINTPLNTAMTMAENKAENKADNKPARLAPAPAGRTTLAAKDGHPLAAYRFDPAATPKAVVVISAGMAIAQSFYAPFARYLAAQGYRVWTFDYRGTGESLPGSMRGAKASLTEWVEKDCDAVLCAAGDFDPGLPLFVIGHSFGGQSAPLLPSRGRLHGLVNIAVGSGAARHVTPRTRRNAPLLWHVLAPLLCPLFGHFPGSRIGVIGDIPSGAMFQWRRWCLADDYILSGEPGARDAYASANFPVLGLFFTDDELLVPSGSRMLHDAYQQTTPDYRLIDGADFGLQRVGHFGFFKSHCEAQLWPMVTQWIDRIGETKTAG